MSDTKVVHVVELAGVNLPLGQFMELACKRMTMEIAHETDKWACIDRLEEAVAAQAKELDTLRKSLEKLENTVDTLFKLIGVGLQRFPHTPDKD
jgi:uncharacterized coiled-coil protein SlyX